MPTKPKSGSTSGDRSDLSHGSSSTGISYGAGDRASSSPYSRGAERDSRRPVAERRRGARAPETLMYAKPGSHVEIAGIRIASIIAPTLRMHPSPTFMLIRNIPVRGRLSAFLPPLRSTVTLYSAWERNVTFLAAPMDLLSRETPVQQNSKIILWACSRLWVAPPIARAPTRSMTSGRISPKLPSWGSWKTQVYNMFAFSSRIIAQQDSLLKSILPSSCAQSPDSLNTAIRGS